LPTGCLALAHIVSEGDALFAGWSFGRLSQTRGQPGVLAIGFVVQQIEIVTVFFQRQENGDGPALCADNVLRRLLAQGAAGWLAFLGHVYLLSAWGENGKSILAENGGRRK
jgi:hypothetical protein